VALPDNLQLGDGNVAVQIVGDGNTVVVGHAHLYLTRYEADRLTVDELAAREPTQLLAARQRSIPAIGRSALLDDYNTWLNNGDPISVRVLVGSAGRGKTRFGLELCDHAADAGWQAGFATADEVRRFRNQQNLANWGWANPVLVVIDYAAAVAEELHGWLAELAQSNALRDAETGAKRPLRVLLLERTADPSSGWLQIAYGRGGGDRDSIDRLLDRPEPFVLPPIEDMAERREVIAQMLAAQGSDLQPPAAGTDPLFDQRLTELSWGGEPLFLMMAASLAARADFASVLALARDDLAFRIADDELARIDRITSTTQHPQSFVHHMVATATLCGGLDRATALDLIGCEEAALHHRLPDGPAGCLALLVQVLPGEAGGIAPVEPDMIGEAVLLRVWGADGGEGASQVITRAAEQVDRSAVVGSVIRTCQDYAIHGHVAPLHWLDALGDTAAQDLPTLLELVNALPAETVELRERALKLTEHVLALLSKRTIEDGGELSQKHLTATCLNNLSIRLNALGRREDALAASEEAVTLNRDLAAARPDAFRPDLAMSLNNLSIRLNALGRREDALAAIEEAVTLYRDLAAARPDAFRPDLAMALTNLSGCLDELGRREDALAASEEAVTLNRDLAAARPDAFRPDLAGSLNNLSGCLDGLGRREDALAAIEEAVTIRRDLAAARPDAFRPVLAGSLNNLSGCLDGLGRREDALAAIEEAVTLYRDLAAARPDAFRQDLAMALNNLSDSLNAVGRPEDALAAIEEAVTLYRDLAAARPDAFRQDLAMALNNLSDSLTVVDRPEDALAASEEAVGLYRDLAAARPDAFQPDLAMAYGTRGQILRNAARHAEAAASFEDGIRALKDPFLELPQASAPLTITLLRDYLQSAEECQMTPDAELIEPIIEKLQEDE
jgi:tetratricopeptide (TPR) repeat protein